MKTLLIITVMLFSLSAYATTENESKADIKNSKVENKLSQEDFNRLTKRIEEIRKMDKSKLSAKEKRELRKELKNDKKLLQPGGGIYIGAGTLLVIIILLILLL